MLNDSDTTLLEEICLPSRNMKYAIWKEGENGTLNFLQLMEITSKV